MPDTGHWQDVLLTGGENLLVEAGTSSSPFVMIMPTRRANDVSRARWQHFVETARRLVPAAVVMLDNTDDRSAFAAVAHEDLPPSVRRICMSVEGGPVDELLIYRVRVAPGLRVLMFHDDDWWEGLPAVPEGGDDASVWLTPLNDQGEGHLSAMAAAFHRPRPFDGASHMNVYFGGISAPVWNAYCDYARRFVPPSPYLDVALDAGARAAGPATPVQGFRYEYNTGNWATPSGRRASHEHYTRISGWGPLAGVHASVVERRMDCLGLLDILCPQQETERLRVLVDAVFAPAPRGRRPRPSLLVPHTVRESFRECVPYGSGLLERIPALRGWPEAYRGVRQSTADEGRRLAADPGYAAVAATAGISDVARLLDEGVQSLRPVVPVAVQRRLDVWETHLANLNARLR